MAKEKFLSIEEVVKKTASVKNRAATLQQDIQKVILSIGYHWQNAYKADNLAEVATWACEALWNITEASPYHRRSVAAYVVSFFPVETDGEGYKPTDIKLGVKAWTEMRETKFWDFAPAPKIQKFDFIEVLQKDVERADKRRQADASKRTDDDVIPTDMIDSVKLLISAHKMGKLADVETIIREAINTQNEDA